MSMPSCRDHSDEDGIGLVACIFAGEPVGLSVDEDTDTRANPGDSLESALRFLGGGCRSVREEPPSEALRTETPIFMETDKVRLVFVDGVFDA